MNANLIEKLTNHSHITGWRLKTMKTVSHEAFYVLNALETRREVNTTDRHVTVYQDFEEKGEAYTGSASFIVPSTADDKTLTRLINAAVHAAGLVKNAPYELVLGKKKATFTETPLSEDPFALLDQIATVHFDQTTKHCKFNAMEAFHIVQTTHIQNSRGVDLTKTLRTVKLETIPTYDGKEQSVELYKFSTLKTVDFDQIKTDALQALKDVEARYNAQKKPSLATVDIVLGAEDLRSLFRRLIQDFSFAGVYKKSTDKILGDPVQKDPEGDTLNVSLIRSSEANRFDDDGFMLKPVTVLEDGILKNHFGDNQHAQYLKLAPTGNLDKLAVEAGTTSIKALRSTPHLEIIALSGLQIEPYAGYIGGEVRLALYRDGRTTIPISGFSFSGNFDEALRHLTLSEETVDKATYRGPAFVKLKNMSIL